MPRLYLIPSPIDQDGLKHLPELVGNTINKLEVFIVERARTSRRFIRQILPAFNLQAAQFIEMDKHDQDLTTILKVLDRKMDVGLLSEAGLPCIADPGSAIVDLARKRGYVICPLTGPSSIMLALMASGMNGQQFTFHGYLPIKTALLKTELKKLSQELNRTGYTQIWIETPYRNQAMLKALFDTLPSDIRLCLGQSLTGKSEVIEVRKIKDWRKSVLAKEPTIFILGR